MGTRTDFRYLSEADCLAAGVLDVGRCVDVAEEVFGLLADGDYLMGGPNHNSHGLGIVFPQQSPFPNMPTAGPDRRFVAMPGYLGGRFDVCGNKWYGSNPANPQRGLPRSVLTLMLNDKDSGEPLCLMSANLLSSARTGAVPGVATRHLVRTDTTSAAVLGCGPINRACFAAIVHEAPTLRSVRCYDLNRDAAAAFASWAHSEFGISGVVDTELQSAVRAADVVSVAASRLAPLVVDDTWFAEGATILVSGPITGNEEFWTRSRIVLDHIGLHEAYVEDATNSPNVSAAYDGVIGGPIYRLIDGGALPALQDFTDLGAIVRGNAVGRQDDRERIVFVACGMSVFDLAWGYELYTSALDKGIGTELCLWEAPVQA